MAIENIRGRKPRSRNVAVSVVAAGMMLAASFASGSASAQSNYPNRTITLVAPYSAGGDADQAARRLSASLTKALGQAVVVQNKVGASGIIGSAQVIAAAPDGYTLLLGRTGSQAILPAIQPTLTKYKWDDYSFIGTLETNPYGCVVSAKSPHRSFDDLVKAMKSGGKAMNYGTAGVMTTNDMGPRLLFRMLKLTDQTPTQIPYKGTGEAVMSLVAGETEFSCGSLGTFVSLIKAGTLRALMVTTAQRLSILPDVPTSRELGYREMEGIVGWSVLMGPPKMPADLREKLGAALKQVLADPAWLSATTQGGSEVFALSPDATRDYVQSQYQLYRTLGESLNLIDSKFQ